MLSYWDSPTSHMTTLLSTAVHAFQTFAQGSVFNGGGLGAGIMAATEISGPVQTDARTFVLILMAKVLNFLALAAVVAIVVAGIFLIFGGGEDTSKTKAKNIIIYVGVGLIVILLARIFVAFMSTLFFFN